MDLTVEKYLSWIEKNELTTKEVVLAYQKQSKLLNESLNAVVRFNDSYVMNHIDDFSKKSLAWLPIMVKDNILVKWEVSTCSSKMLENYKAPYSATCMKNMEDAWALMIWQTYH